MVGITAVRRLALTSLSDGRKRVMEVHKIKPYIYINIKRLGGGEGPIVLGTEINIHEGCTFSVLLRAHVLEFILTNAECLKGGGGCSEMMRPDPSVVVGKYGIPMKWMVL